MPCAARSANPTAAALPGPPSLALQDSLQFHAYALKPVLHTQGHVASVVGFDLPALAPTAWPFGSDVHHCMGREANREKPTSELVASDHSDYQDRCIGKQLASPGISHTPPQSDRVLAARRRDKRPISLPDLHRADHGRRSGWLRNRRQAASQG